MSFLSDLFGKKKSASVIGIDIGSSSLKVVQLRREGGTAVLETYGEIALGPSAGVEVGQATNLPAEKVTEALKDLLHEASVTSTNAGVSIPFSRSLLTLVELPRRDNPEEQKTVISLEARKYIPVPIQEVQLDWFILPDREAEGAAPSSKVRVLLVAVHNDELSLLQNVVAGAGVAASFYEIELFSTIRAVVDEPVKPVLVIDIGAATTKAYIVERGVIELSHVIQQGGQDVTRAIATSRAISVKDAEALKKTHGLTPVESAYGKEVVESVFSRIFDEARRALQKYETASQKAVSALVLTGGGGVTKGLGAYAQNVFPIPVAVADPFAKVSAPAFMRPVLSEIGPEFAVSVGLALRKLEELG